MIHLIRKISVIILACLLVLNVTAGAAAVAEHCSSPMVSSPMDIHHCDGLLNFVFPTIKCCEHCNDIFCDLMKDPLQDANALTSSTFQSSSFPIFTETVHPSAESGDWTVMFEPRYLFTQTLTWSQTPLYIEHLALII